MTKKGFLIGIPTSLFVGITFSFYNLIVAIFLGVGTGALLGSSKKSGGAIGLLTAPLIHLAPTYIPLIPIIISGGGDILFIALILGGALINITTTIFTVLGIVLGVIIGHISSTIPKKQEEKQVEPTKEEQSLQA